MDVNSTTRTDREVYKISAKDIGYEAVGVALCKEIEKDLNKALLALAELEFEGYDPDAYYKEHEEIFKKAMEYKKKLNAAKAKRILESLDKYIEKDMPV